MGKKGIWNLNRGKIMDLQTLVVDDHLMKMDNQKLMMVNIELDLKNGVWIELSYSFLQVWKFLKIDEDINIKKSPLWNNKYKQQIIKKIFHNLYKKYKQQIWMGKVYIQKIYIHNLNQKKGCDWYCLGKYERCQMDNFDNLNLIMNRKLN